jgi:hypothetical protein
MDARALFGQYLDLAPLKGRSAGLVRCCFHGEDRHPSLSVDLDRGLFHCFTCGIGGGVRRFAEAVDAPIPTRRAATQPVAGGALSRAFERATREGRWYARWEALFVFSDVVRRSMAVADRARALGHALGPEHPWTWDLLEHAARVETHGRWIDAELERLYADGPLALPRRP